MEKNNKTNFSLAVFFVFAGVVLRLIPHAPNFAPISAIAIFSGSKFSKKWGVTIAVLAMLVSDLFLGFYNLWIMASVYVCFIFSVFLGSLLKSRKNFAGIILVSLLSSLLFFIVTNFAVFTLTSWYEKTFSGLIYCYFMALPFFRNTLFGDVFYSFMFFGLFELALLVFKKYEKNINYWGSGIYRFVSGRKVIVGE